MNGRTWKEALGSAIPAAMGAEIDDFETDLELRRQGRSDERLFNEARLRRGVYGQRYDNGSRHDGERTRLLAYPSGGVLKGPGTLWDAPGMQRVKIPFGSLTAAQMDVLADLADEYSTGVLHVTTRQDLQLHFVHIDDTPDLMRRLAAVGITTLEACGNAVRNVTACPLAGVCEDEPFDVSLHARALARFLLGHPDAQDFGRKFKVSFSGCKEASCGLAAFHDLGFIARVRERDGVAVQGFELWVGGGLGPVPHQAQAFSSFVPTSEVLPLAQAVCRVFARLGEKKNRARARLKFLVAELGIEEFRRLVTDERATLAPDPAWGAHLPGAVAPEAGDTSAGPGASAPPPTRGPWRVPADATMSPDDVGGTGSPAAGYATWVKSNVRPQRQAGYVVAAVTLPLGDVSATQMRALARLAARLGDDSVRTTVEQNIVFRGLPEGELPCFYAKLAGVGLADAGAGSIVDVTSCPGTDTCKLGIASSRGLAGTLRERLLSSDILADRAVKNLHIKVSGCFNSCGQHHVADIGFYGVSRKVEGRTVPHFQVVLGGQWEDNAGAFGMAIGAVPSKRIPDVVDRLTDWYRREGRGDERFREFVRRTGKVAIRSAIDDLTAVPGFGEARHLYSDWGDPREFSVGDMGVGECAGEVVSRFDFAIAAAERRVFEAQIRLDRHDVDGAAHQAYTGMLQAADALVRELASGTPPPASVGEVFSEANGSGVVSAFRARLVETRLFQDPFAGAKFANYLFALHEKDRNGLAAATAKSHVEEAQLFIEASHACYARLEAARGEARAGGGS